MQQSTFSSKTNVCEGQTIRIIAEEPRSFGTGVHLNRNIQIAVTSNTITIPAATGTVQTVRLSKKNSGWIKVEPKSLIRRIFICCPFGSRATASFHTFTQRYIYQLFGICCFPSFQSTILSHPGTVPDREWIEPPNRPGQRYNLLYKR